MGPKLKVSTPRILIVDDYEVTRRGVRASIESHDGWQICGEAATGLEAVEKARIFRPDVVVMDIAMPGMNGLEASHYILKANPETEVVIFTKYAGEHLVLKALEIGVRGYVLKSAPAQDLVAAVEALSKHEAYFSESVAKLVVEGYRKRIPQDELSGLPRPLLSPREREILQLLAEGKSNREAGEALHLSAKTVETHRAHIMAKLNLHSITDLVRYAIRNNIVEP